MYSDGEGSLMGVTGMLSKYLEVIEIMLYLKNETSYTQSHEWPFCL